LFSMNDDGMMPLCLAANNANNFVVACLLEMGSKYINDHIGVGDNQLTFLEYVNHKHQRVRFVDADEDSMNDMTDESTVIMSTALDCVLERNVDSTRNRVAGIAAMLIASGVEVGTAQIEEIKMLRETCPNSRIVRRLARMAVLCRSSDNIYQRTWKIPLEIMRMISTTAIRDDEVMQLLHKFNGKEVHDEDLPTDEDSGDEDAMADSGDED
jgi:ribosomal protein L36